MRDSLDDGYEQGEEGNEVACRHCRCFGAIRWAFWLECDRGALQTMM
jgi:hypothetical protein